MSITVLKTEPPAPMPRPRILCVDDEPSVLEGLTLHLRRRFEVTTATTGAAGLACLRETPDVAVVLSDMRMPVMNGATFLRESRAISPDATRVLLTGQSDTASAIAAINEGQIFRFLSKPCPPADLLTAMDAALEQHRLITAERVLLEQTLHGSIKALTDALSLVHPLAFGRATRIKTLASQIAAAMKLQDRWQIEVAAMLSQLGSLVLPAEIVEKLYYGASLDPAEQALVARAPETIETLLGPIPRLEVVRAMLARLHKAPPVPRHAMSDTQVAAVESGAALLRAAQEFDALEAQGCSASLAVDTLRSRAGLVPAAVLDALAAVRGADDTGRQVRETAVHALRPGMVLAEDLKTHTGALFVPRGYEVTLGLMERIRLLRPGAIRSTVRVIVP